MTRILLIDALSTAFTHWHAKDNTPEASFIRNLREIIKTYKVDKAILLREGGSKYRNELLPTYKSGRKERREKQSEAEKKDYQRFLKASGDLFDLMGKLGVGSLQLQGAEADDIAGFLCATLPSDEYQILLLSEDSDWNQLLQRPNTVQGSYRKMSKDIFNLNSGYWLSAKAYEREKGITVQQAFEVKMLCGDKSDSIPGIEGLGDTGALNLIKRYGSLEEVLKNRLNIDVPRITAKAKESLASLEKCKEVLGLGYQLMNLRWTPEEWVAKIGFDQNFMHNCTKEVEFDEAGFTELCYENGWLGLAEEDFLDPYKKLLTNQ